MKRLVSIILVGVLLCLLCGCGGNAPQGAEGLRTLVDGSGRAVEVPEKVESIVCVGVGALRYTCYMQGQDLVIGVEDYETKAGMDRLYNYVHFERFKDLPVIGGNGQPFVEEIIAVNPQVIVMSRSASVEAEELQSKTGIPVVVVPGSDTTLDENCYETIRILGQLFGKEARAQELTAYLQGLAQELGGKTRDLENKPTAYVCGVSFKGAHGFEGTEAGYGPFALIHAENLADTTGQTGASPPCGRAGSIPRFPSAPMPPIWIRPWRMPATPPPCCIPRPSGTWIWRRKSVRFLKLCWGPTPIPI